MSRIVKKVNEEVLKRTARRCRERGIVIPTFAQMRDPSLVPATVAARLPRVDPNAVDPAQPLPHHLEERSQDRPLRRPQLPRDPAAPSPA